MKRIFFLWLTGCITLTCFAQQGAVIKKKSPFNLGETIQFYSNILQEDRLLNIYLPQGYSADSAKEYPTIYVLDGSADEDFIHIAGLVHFLSFSWIEGMPECIVVGIANVDRRRDFTYPTHNQQDKADFPTTGGSEKFITYLGTEVQFLIRKTYHTNGSNTLLGQSLGGLLATEILIKKPEMFDNYLIVSPSLWWDDESLLKVGFAGFNHKKSVYVAVGEEGPQMKKLAKALYTKLKKDPTGFIKTYFEYFPRLNHGDALHQAAYNGFLKIFATRAK